MRKHAVAARPEMDDVHFLFRKKKDELGLVMGIGPDLDYSSCLMAMARSTSLGRGFRGLSSMKTFVTRDIVIDWNILRLLPYLLAFSLSTTPRILKSTTTEGVQLGPDASCVQ